MGMCATVMSRLMIATAALLLVPTTGFGLDFFVGTTDDTNDGLCTPSGAPIQEICSLREALIEANGNPSFLSAEGEAYRWSTDAAAIVASTRSSSMPQPP